MHVLLFHFNYPNCPRKMKSSILTMFLRLILPFFLLCATAAAASAAQLQKIEHKTLAAGTEEVVLSFNTVVEPKVFTMGGKQPRLVFDFEGVEPYRTLRDLAPGAAVVKGVRLGIHRQGEVKTRLVFDVNSLQGLKHSYKVDEGKKRLVIRFTGAGAAVAAKEKPAQTAPARLQAEASNKRGSGQETATVSRAAEKQKEKETEKEAAVPVPARKETVAARKPVPAPVAEAEKKSARQETAAPAPTPEVAPAPAPEVASGPTQPTQPAQPVQPLGPAQPAAPAGTTAASPAPTAAVPAAPTDAPYLSAIQFDPDSPRGELVQFKLNGFYPPVLRSIETGNPQVICEFTNLQVAPALEGPIKISGRFVKAIRLDKAADGSKVRVFVELEPNQSYDLQQVFFKEDNFFVLIVNTVKA